MGNNPTHYFGAYLEIKTKKITLNDRVRQCENGHQYSQFHTSMFCEDCGLEVKTDDVVESIFPTFVYDHLLDDEKWEDALSDITPPKLFQTDTMIAISGISNHRWLRVDNDHGDTQVKIFPTAPQIESMKKGLVRNCKEIITALRQSEYVVSVTIRAGYVLDAEY